nr:hypothetical protein [Sorangium cellulosum]
MLTLDPLLAAHGDAVTARADHIGHRTGQPLAEIALIDFTVAVIIPQVADLGLGQDIILARPPLPAGAHLRAHPAFTDAGDLRIPMAALHAAADAFARVVGRPVTVLVEPVALVDAREHVALAVAPDAPLARLLAQLAAPLPERRFGAAVTELLLTGRALAPLIHEPIAVVVALVADLLGRQEVADAVPPDVVRALLGPRVAEPYAARERRASIALLPLARLAGHPLVDDAVAVVVEAVRDLVAHPHLGATGVRQPLLVAGWDEDVTGADPALERGERLSTVARVIAVVGVHAEDRRAAQHAEEEPEARRESMVCANHHVHLAPT